MTIETELINGFGFGVEYFKDEYFGKGLVIEILFLRLVVQWGDN